jgi:hypothetical protein
MWEYRPLGVVLPHHLEERRKTQDDVDTLGLTGILAVSS